MKFAIQKQEIIFGGFVVFEITIVELRNIDITSRKGPIILKGFEDLRAPLVERSPFIKSFLSIGATVNENSENLLVEK